MKKEKEKKKKREKHLSQTESGRMESAVPDTDDCDPMDSLLDAVGGKWKIRILWVLRGGESMRYGDIKHHIHSITDMMLSQSLRELTESGLVTRQQFQQIPPRVEYQMTPEGSGLIPAMELMAAWALKYKKEER